MEKCLYIFNPDTDLALADGSDNYIPPHSIIKMINDLSTLPHWYGEEVAFTSAEEARLSSVPITRIVPWGWNSALIKRLKTIGIEERLLPDETQMSKIRGLSHRSLAIRLLQPFIISNDYCGSATELFSESQIQAFIESHNSTLLKAPWSGSGKGLCFCKNIFTPAIRQWCKNILKKQGSVVGEILYNKVKDFAMEFYSDGKGDIQFVGYSAFLTDSKGAYKSNLLASNSDIKEILTHYIPSSLIETTRQSLLSSLTNILGKDYQGYLGIDMMICSFPEKPFYRLHPCVEINLRMNMGVVSRIIYDRYISPTSTGHFRIEYYTNPHTLIEEHQYKIKNYPLIKNTNGKIVSGYLALTPITNECNYCASILCTNNV